MWALANRTPYGAERTWVRDIKGEHHWIVAVKATFDIAPNGALKLADEQPPPLHEPEYYGEPGASSLRFDADLVHKKPNTDVIVNAHAYAPDGKPTRSVNVQMRVGHISKELVAHGPRVYYRGIIGLTTSKAEPFTKYPIRYEWAYGGTDMSDPNPLNQKIDLRNPIGKGVAARSANLRGQPAHRVEYPKGNPAKVGPAGFGAIASYWSPRLELAGTYDTKWEESQKPLLPKNYDQRFVLCAPEDQRPPRYLRGGELVELINLSEGGILRTQLPSIYLTFKTTINGRFEDHRSVLASVIIEPEEKQLLMVWQTSLPVAATEGDYLDVTTIREKPFIQ